MGSSPKPPHPPPTSGSSLSLAACLELPGGSNSVSRLFRLRPAAQPSTCVPHRAAYRCHGSRRIQARVASARSAVSLAAAFAVPAGLLMAGVGHVIPVQIGRGLVLFAPWIASALVQDLADPSSFGTAAGNESDPKRRGMAVCNARVRANCVCNGERLGGRRVLGSRFRRGSGRGAHSAWLETKNAEGCTSLVEI